MSSTFAAGTVFMHQRWQLTPLGHLPMLLWCSKPSFKNNRLKGYYAENFPYHYVTLKHDVEAVTLYSENTWPEDLAERFPITEDDIVKARECSQDAHAPEFVAFFRHNPKIAVLFYDNEYENEFIIMTNRCELTISELQHDYEEKISFKTLKSSSEKL